MKKKYVVQLQDDSIIIISSTQFPKSSEYKHVLPDVPDGTRHGSELILVDVDDGLGGTKKAAQLDDTKVAAYDQILADEANEVQIDLELKKRVTRLSFCQEIKARVAILNDSKGWNVSQFQAYMADPIVQQLSGMLGDGYLDMAKDLIENTDLSTYYTTEEKQGIVDRIDVYLNNE